MNEKRIYYLDMLRTLACLCVIMVHVSEFFIVNSYSKLNIIISGSLDAISRFCVPVFFMISGALLLDESKKIESKKITHRIIRIIFIFIFWTIISLLTVYYDDYILPIINPPHFGQLLNCILSGYAALWYLKVLIGIYLLTPILKLWVNKKNKKYVEYYLIISIIISIIIPTICYFGGHHYEIFNIINNNLYYVNISNCFITYYILGWYLHNYPIKRKKWLYFFSSIGVLSSILLFYFFIGRYTNFLDVFGIFQIFTFLYSITIFIFFKEKEYKKKIKLVELISKYNLGIYVSHSIIAITLYDLGSHFSFIADNYFLALILIYTLTIIISLLITFIINKIPIIKKIVNLQD